MKENKGVHVTKHKIRDDQKLVYNIYRSDKDYRHRRYENRNFGSQYDSRRDNICTCKNALLKKHEVRYFSGLPKQVYAYHGLRGAIDIGVGSVTAVQRRRVKRIYLPETDDTGVGSSDLSSFVIRKRFPKVLPIGSYIERKKTSSKCVGGILEYNTGCVVSQKLSPFIHTKSGATSPKISLVMKKNTEIGSHTINNITETRSTQFEVITPITPHISEAKSEKQDPPKVISQAKYSKAVMSKKLLTKPSKKVSEQTQKSKYSVENIEDIKKNSEHKKAKEPEKVNKKVSQKTQSKEAANKIVPRETQNTASRQANTGSNDKDTYSSDSLVQHVHNLENPSDEKHISHSSFPDPMENKLEREYRRMFSTTKSKESKTDKPIPEFKSASILRRRFEALRRGIAKKDDSNTKEKESDMIQSSNSPINVGESKMKDASVTSDPPSLVSRSYSNTKPLPQTEQVKKGKNKSSSYKTDRTSANWQQHSIESESQGVKGMFKLWGKKFNFEEDAYGKRQATPMPSYDQTKKPAKKEDIPKKQSKKDKEKEKDQDKEKDKDNQKHGKTFFFFKKKSKLDKPKEVSVPNKDVTAGRCEVKDRIVMNIGQTANSKAKPHSTPEEGKEFLRKAWLNKFLTDTIESVKSVNVRWNNSMYATSSSTVFELLDSVYKNNGVVIKSQSDISTGESSCYKSFTKQVNFVQDIEAWMIPKMITDRKVPVKHVPYKSQTKQVPLRIKSKNDNAEKNMNSTISDQQWCIEKTEAFAHRIEVEIKKLQAITPNVENKKVSSEYLRIDIPGDFFDTSSDESKQNQSSDELVYNIVEYETNSEIGRIRKTANDFQKGDRVPADIKMIVCVKDSKSFESKVLETVIKRPPNKDITEGSFETEPSLRCDVIGVGIITQRDMREVRKPILKIRDETTDDDSEPVIQLTQKKCEFAESYFQEYCRDLTPMGYYDLYPWCASDSRFRSGSERSFSSNPNIDGSKSCPNILENYATTIVTPCETPSVPCKHCTYDELSKRNLNIYNRFMSKFKTAKKPEKTKTKPKPQPEKREDKCPKTDQEPLRIFPKDSLEVWRKRRLYAASNKSDWVKHCAGQDKIVSVPSIPSKPCSQAPSPTSTLVECPKIKKPVIVKPRSKYCKRVIMSDCESLNQSLSRQLADRPEGILTFKGVSKCDVCKKPEKTCKHAKIQPFPSCEIPQPACKPICESMKKPHCNKPHAPSCHGAPNKPSDCKIPICPRPALPPECGESPISYCKPEQPPCKTPLCPSGLPSCTPPPCHPGLPCKDPPPCGRTPCEPGRSSPCPPPPCKSASPPCHHPPTPCESPPPPCKSPSPPPCKPPPPPPCMSSPPPPCKSPPPPPCKSPPPPPCHHPPPPCKSPSPCESLPPPPCKHSPPCKSPPPCPIPKRRVSCSKYGVEISKKSSKKHPCSRKPSTCKHSSPHASSQFNLHYLPNTPPLKLSCTSFNTDNPSPFPPCKTPMPCTLPPPCSDFPPCDKSATCAQKPVSACDKKTSCCKKPKPCCPPPKPSCAMPSGEESPMPVYKKSSCCERNPSGSCSMCIKSSPAVSASSSASSCASSASSKSKNSESSCGSAIDSGQLHEPKPCDPLPCPPKPVCPPDPCHPPPKPSCPPKPCPPKPCDPPPKPCPPKPCDPPPKLCPPNPKPKPRSPPPESCMSPRPSGISLTQAPTPPCHKPPKPPKPVKKRRCYNMPPCDLLDKEPGCCMPPIELKCPRPKPESPPCKPKMPDCFKHCIMKEPPCPPEPEPDCVSISSNISCCNPKGPKPELPGHCAPKPPPHQEAPCAPPPIIRRPYDPCHPETACVPQDSPLPPKPSCPQKPPCPPQPVYPDPCHPPPEPKQCPPPQAKPSCPPKPCPPNPCKRISGLHLRMKPSRKTCDDDCGAWSEVSKMFKISHEKITIKIKEPTPSTSEIREPCNIRIEDEDGSTLFERKDYVCENQRDSVLGDVYRASKINRVTTPMTVMENETKKRVTTCKSEPSLANLVEINLKLRVMQGDKTTEIDIGSIGDEKLNDPDTKKSAPEIYVMNKNGKEITEDVPKNDINIKITVRNFKPKQKMFTDKDKTCTDDFAKKISEKFHTVSTGYSDVEDNVFSIHRATINLASSTNLIDTCSRITNEIESKQDVKLEPNLLVLSNETHVFVTDADENDIETVKHESNENIEIVSSKKISEIESMKETKSELPEFNDTDEQDSTLLGLVTSTEGNDDSIISKIASKEQKKTLLKKVFSKVGKRSKNKENVRELRDMLKIILTDSSDNDESHLSTNELAKDVTYASLKPNFFKDSDSMNNYYKINGSNIEFLYPTEEMNSRTSERSDSDANDVTFQGCMCNKIAEKLNKARVGQVSGCCCRVKERPKQDEEVSCDLRRSADYFPLNYNPTESVDAQTHNSARNSFNNYLPNQNTIRTIHKNQNIEVIREITRMNSPKANIETQSCTKRVSKTLSQRKSFPKGSSITAIEDIHVVEEIRTIKSPHDVEENMSQRISLARASHKTTAGDITVVESIKIVSSKTPKTSKKASKNSSKRKTVGKQSDIHNIYQNTAIGHFEKDNVLSVKLNEEDQRNRKEERNLQSDEGDREVLQSFAAKKAVLEIYAEKTDTGENFVAKLPKFVLERESELEKCYEQLASTSYKSVCKENVFMMSVQR